MRNNLLNFILVLIVAAFAVTVVIPKSPSFYGKDLKIKLGLDLQGGAQLLYTIDTTNLNGKTPSQAQTETVHLIERRVNGLGVSEALVQATRVGNEYGVIVELPGIQNLDEAKNIIGKTAQLRFYELNAQNEMVPTDLTGADVTKAVDTIQTQSAGINANSPIISLEFSSDGAKKFDEITKRNVGKPLITKLDDQVINTATVQTEISGGKAIIEGIKTQKEAKETAQLISEGALPAPVELVQENQVGATLGKDVIEKSLVAGLFGIILVAVFMIVYYKGLGLVADLALLIYVLLVISIFKLAGVTLTLAGIAGFIFSIGAAVDANVLVFARYKEELKRDLPRTQALENGFTRSWPSIRDSNIASIITALILFYLTSGTVKGFGLTLFIGIIVSMFTALFVTRTILRFFIKGDQTS